MQAKWVKKWQFGLSTMAMAVLAACGGSGSGSSDTANNDGQLQASETNNPALELTKQCIQNSPLLKYGENHRAPAINPVPKPASIGVAQINPGACSSNTSFNYGAGFADITGPAGGKIHMGNESPTNYSSGVQTRQYARTFVIGSDCNGKRVALVSTETGMMFESVRQAVLDAVATDPELAGLYTADNLMMNATHTHSTPGGQAHYTAYNFFRFGFDEQTFRATVDGIVKSLKIAHTNYTNAPTGGPISIIQDELIGASVSRAPEAYLANNDSERAKHRDITGGEIDTNRLMTLLRLQRDDGKEVGSLNWFAVHPTSDADESVGAVPISGDNKGHAMALWERMVRSSSSDPSEPFVSSFQQADEGDTYSILWHRDPDIREERHTQLLADGHPDEPFPLTIANGVAQLSKALELYDQPGQALQGGVDFRFGYVKMDEMTVTDPVILASLEHPPELDSEIKETCTAAMGFSFPAGGGGEKPGEFGGFTRHGLSCNSNADVLAGLQRDLPALAEGRLPTEALAYAVGCNFDQIPGLNLQCQAEKPVLLVFGPPLNVSANVVPFQLFRIGNLAIVGLPWEITTMAGRRIRDTVLNELKEVGVDYAVINGLSNDYVSYLTTREEYAVQRYEGASNQFGPWSLAVVQQEMRRLATDMKLGQASELGPIPPRSMPWYPQVLPANVVDLTPPGTEFGAVVADVAPSYVAGTTASATFQTADPNNNLLTDDSFLFVEKLLDNGSWKAIATDNDPETTFVWRTDTPEPQFNPSPVSQAEIVWRIPANAAGGTYRLRHQGFAQTTTSTELTRFEGVSSPFSVEATGEVCGVYQ